MSVDVMHNIPVNYSRRHEEQQILTNVKNNIYVIL